MADENDRRYPPNLRGLLAFCTEYTKNEDAPSESNFTPMSEERRKWLSQAIDGIQGTDPVKLMLEDVRTVLDEDITDLERKETAMENIQMYTEDIDLANDFHKIGGFHLITRLLKSEHVSLRWRAADLVANLTQNNPYCQREILNYGLLPVLVKILDDPSEDEQVRIKALYALSCLTRESTEAQDELVKCDGLSVLLRAIQSDVDKLQIKAAFLMSILCQQQQQFKDILCKMGMVEQLIGLLSMEHSALHEHLVAALFHLVTDNELAQKECHRPEFNLRSLLEQKKRDLHGQEQFQEELEFVSQLYDLCFHSPSSQTSQPTER